LYIDKTKAINSKKAKMIKTRKYTPNPMEKEKVLAGKLVPNPDARDAIIENTKVANPTIATMGKTTAVILAIKPKVLPGTDIA
jgi:hypothetical protein